MTLPKQSKLWRLAFITLPGIVLLKNLRFSERNPRLVLTIFVFLVACLLPGLAHLKILLSVSDSVAAESTLGLNQARKKSAFAGDQELTILFQRQDRQILSEKDLCEIRSWVRKVDFSHQEVQYINSPFNARYGKETAQTLTYPLVISLNCESPSDSSRPLAEAASSPLTGTLVSQDQKSILVVIYLRNTPGGSKFGAFDPNVVASLESALTQTFSNKDAIKFSLSGGAAFKLDFLRSLMRDQWVNLLVLVIFCTGFRIIFGSWRGALLLGGSLLTANLILFASMGIADVPVDMLTNSIFTIVALASIEDFVFLAHMHQGSGFNNHWRRSFRKLILPSFYTSLSTVIGFLSLCLSDIVSIKRLGLWAAVGAGLEFIIVFILIPAVMSLSPKYRRWTGAETGVLARGIHKLCMTRIPRLVCLALIGLVPIGVVGISKIQTRDALSDIWDRDHSFNTGVKLLNQALGWSAAVDLVIPAGNNPEKAEQIISQISKLPGVVRIESPTAYINYAAQNLSYERVMLMYREMMLSESASYWYSKPSNLIRVSVFVANSQLTTLSPLFKDIGKVCEPVGCFVTGDLVAYVDYADKVIATLTESFLVSLALVACLLLALARAVNLAKPIPMIFASMWGPVVLLGLGPWIFGGLNFITCVFAAVLVGLAGDSSIQYLFSSRRGDITTGMNQSGSGSVQMTILAVAGSLAFLTSDFAQPRTLGLLFAAGFVALLIGDLWILKELTRWIGTDQTASYATRFNATKVQSSTAFSEPKISS